MALLQASDGVNIGTILSSLGGERGLTVDLRQMRASYRASTIAPVAVVSGTAPFWSLYAGSIKIVRVTRIFVTGTIAVAAANAILLLSRRNTPITGGTASAMTAVPMDANDIPKDATIQAYTAAPTAGTLVGTVESRRILLPVTGAVATQDVLFDYTPPAIKPIILRGNPQGVDLSFQVAPGNVSQLTTWVEWTEE